MRAVVDRVESGMATLLLGETETVVMQIPVGWLPEHASEGAILRITCTIDTIATTEAQETIRKLRDSLPNEP